MTERASFDFFLDAAELPPDDMPIPAGPAVVQGPKLGGDDSHKKAATKRAPKQQRSPNPTKLDYTNTMTPQVGEVPLIQPVEEALVPNCSAEPDIPMDQVLTESAISLEGQSSQNSRTIKVALERTAIDNCLPSEIISSDAKESVDAQKTSPVEITPQRKTRARVIDSCSITPPNLKVVQESKTSTLACLESEAKWQDHALISRKRMRVKGPVKYLDQSIPSVGAAHRARVATIIEKSSPNVKAMTQAPNDLITSECLALVPYKRPARATPSKRRNTFETPAQKNQFYDMLRGTHLEEVVLDPIEQVGTGRPKRRRIPPLEFWRGEVASYERLPGSDGLTMTAVVYNTAGGNRDHQLAIMDKARLPALEDKPRLKALKDK